MQRFTWKTRFTGFVRRAQTVATSRRRHSRLPELEPVEDRRLLSAAGLHHHPVGHTHAAREANPLAPYRIFIGNITRGPDAGTTFQGPIVLGYSGRINVIGEFFSRKGPIDAVVGTQTGGSVALRIVLPGQVALEAVGTGNLQSVRGGLPDGDSLVGFGTLSGPANSDFGSWATVIPSRVATS